MVKNEIARQARLELSRRHLLDFTLHTFPQYEVGWHHKAYAKKLDEFAQGKIKKLMIFMPPQHGKSEMSSRRLPAFCLGQNPDKRIAIVAYNSIIAEKFNRDTKRIIDTDEYCQLFPETRLPLRNENYINTAEEFEIPNHKGSLVSVGVGGGLTSRSIDLLIMDDLYKDAQSAWSATTRSGVQDWYDTVAKTRLHNGSQQLIVFTRWHEEDLAGYLLQRENDWEVLIFPAIKTGEPNDYDPREDGEALWELRHSLDELEKTRKNNPIVFDSLYQQNPTPKEGLLFPASELKRFRMEQIKGMRPDAIISACDTADEGDDNLCHPIAYVFGKNVYFVHVNFSQDPIEITQPLVASAIDKYGVSDVTFESNNGGKGYAITVKNLLKGRAHVRWQPTSTNKHTRILMKSGIIKDYCFFLVDEEQNEEYRKYFYELTHYPKNGKVKHDDAADGTTMVMEKTDMPKPITATKINIRGAGR